MITNKIITRGLILILLAVSINVSAQKSEVTQDFELWNSFAISKKISKNWKITLEEEFRFTEDVSRFDVFSTDLGVDYKITKNFAAGLNYRFYRNKNKYDIFESQQRFSANVNYKQKLDRFTFGYKLQFQNKDEDFLSSSSDNSVYNLRNKLSVDYNINNFKLDPYFQVELFRKYESGEDANFNKLRWTLGTSYPVTKKSDVQLFYRLDNELNQTYTKNTYILGLGYKISF